MANPRHATSAGWTDQRLDDLASKVDEQGLRMDAGFARLDARIDQQSARMDAGFARLDARIDAQGAELGARIDAQGAETRELGVSLGARIDANTARIDGLQRTMLQVGSGAIVSILVTGAGIIATQL